MTGFFIVVIIVGFFIFFVAKRIKNSKNSPNSITRRRRIFIESYTFPDELLAKFRQKHPDLESIQVSTVFEGLRQYFLIALRADAVNGNPVAMPSKLVDDAWHEFILFTQLYELFCMKAFGKTLHHTPFSDATNASAAKTQMQRAWDTVKAPGYTWAMLGAVPLLFAIDQAYASSLAASGAGAPLMNPQMLEQLEKQRMLAQSQTSDGGSSFSSDSNDPWDRSQDSSDSGWDSSDSSSDSSDSGGDGGGGDGGGGCGGGCGGGGD